MLKKVTLGLIAALGVSASALAAGPGLDVPIPAAPASINVTAPVQQGSWEIGLEGAFVQPGSADFIYAQRFDGGDNFKDFAIKPTHQWMGHADVTFNIPGNGRYVQLGGTYMNSSHSNSTTANTLSTGLVQAPIVGFADFLISGGYDAAKGTSTTHYSDVDLVFGQKVDVGERLRLKFFGGLRYASIDADSKGRYTNVNASGVLTREDSLKLDSNFSGVGPRAGIDTEVNLDYGFSIIGRIAGSLLVGDLDQKADFDSFVPASGTTPASVGDADFRTNSQVRVVPEADARIGVHYNYAFNPATSVGLELGYEVENYFSAESNDAFGVVLPNTTRVQNDFSFHGPYFRLQVNLA